MTAAARGWEVSAPRWATVPADVANQVMVLAWTRGGGPEMAELLRPYVGDLGTALALCERWMPRRLDADDRVPAFLPTGQALPESPTPWTRDLSPLPGVDLPVEAVRALAVDALVERVILDRRRPAPANALYKLLLPERASFDTLAALLDKWVSEGRALACLRAALPADWPVGLLSPEETRAVLPVLSSISGRRRVDNDVRASLEPFVARGVDPLELVEALRQWTPESGLLPTGQPIDPQWVDAKELGPRTIAGVTLSASLLVGVKSSLRHDFWRSVRRLTEETDCDASTALAIIERLMNESGVQWRSDTRAARAVDIAMTFLVTEFPLHWLSLATARIVEDPTHPTMAVGFEKSGQLVLFFNPEFVLAISPEECAGVLVHEVDHVLFGHLEPGPVFRSKSPEKNERSAEAWTAACECTANEFVSFPLPGQPITIELLNLPPMESTRRRYERLRNRRRALAQGAARRVEKCVVTVRLRPGAAAHTDTTGHDVLRGAGAILLSDVALALPAELVESAADTLKRRGGEDLGLTARLRAGRTSRIDWRAELRSLSRELSRPEASLRYPNRRQPEAIGVVPGRRRRRARPRILVAIDTSGSMEVWQLEQVSAELHAMLRLDLRVAVIECDMIVQRHRWFERTDRLTQVRGRGGTDLRLPFAPDVLRTYDPDAIVYFTDGIGPAPQAPPPPWVRVLWVLAGSRETAPVPWGRVVRM